MINWLSVFKSIKILDVSCNDFVAHFLTEDGMLYSMGNDTKKYGLLGLGAVYHTPQPVLNQSLVDFRISKVAVGLSHTCALTMSGQLYSWGTGQNGQLCLSDDTMFSNVPKLVQSSKRMQIKQLYCSNYYTLLVTSKGQVTMFGTLKGFAKFLFESPTKDVKSDFLMRDESISFSRTSEKISNKLKLVLNNEIVSKVSIAERAFAVYCEASQNLYFVGEDFDPQLILNRELKSFQFLNGSKYIVCQDSSNLPKGANEHVWLRSAFA